MFGGRSEIKIEWRPVVGFEKYEVSNDGRVRSLYYGGKELKPYTQPYGHQEVKLRKDKKTHATTVGVLVASAFIGPRPEGLMVCHNDGDPTNNSVENLRWDTQASNIRDSVRHGTHPNASKEKCSKGHYYNTENTRINTKGWRICRQCHRVAERRRQYARHSKRTRD